MLALGIVLIVVGAGLLVAEAHVPSMGAIGAAGTAAMVAGVVLAIAASGAGLALAIPVAAAVAAVGAGFLLVAVPKTAAAQRRRALGGSRELIGKVGVVRSVPTPRDPGQVLVGGALWRAHASEIEDDAGLALGERVVVEEVHGLTLSVRRAEQWELAP